MGGDWLKVSIFLVILVFGVGCINTLGLTKKSHERRWKAYVTFPSPSDFYHEKKEKNVVKIQE